MRPLVRIPLIWLGCLLLVGATSACPTSGSSLPAQQANQANVSGAVTEVIVFNTFSCPDEIIGYVSGHTDQHIDLSARSGTITFTDHDGTTYSGSGSLPTGSGNINLTLKSADGSKTITIEGNTACK